MVRDDNRQQRIETAVRALLLVGLAVSSLESTFARPLEAALQMSQSDVARLATALLSERVTVVAPSFVEKDSTLYYYLGEVVLPVNLEATLAATDPVRLPLRDQMRIELLRHYVARKDNQHLTFLEPVLRSAEAIVSRSLKEIRESQGDSTALLDRLEEYSTEITGMVDQAIQNYGRARPVNVFKTGRSVLASKKDVWFSSTPPGGVVSYVLEYDWANAIRSHKQPPWRVVVESKTTLLAGSYRLRVVWPDVGQTGGVKESEYTIDIVNGGNLDVKPLR